MTGKTLQSTNKPSDDALAQTHFGFKTVNAKDKQGQVNEVFDKVASRYDLMNDLMSGGLHRAWKAAMIDWLAPPKGARAFNVVDVAGGTGDIAFRLLNRGGEQVHVTLCDINPAMIQIGAERAQKQSLGDQTSFVVGNAEALSFPDQSFDAYTIAFGIRNVTDIQQALYEAYRVLKPGGRFLCLEFSCLDIPGLNMLYDAYSFQAIPFMGKLVTGDAEPYRYLVESIRKFPDQEKFKQMIAKAGFERVSYRNLSGGIAALHSAWRL